MENQLLVITANQVNQELEGQESKIIEIVKKTYLAHHEGKSALPQSIFLRFPNDDRNRIIGLPAYLGGDMNVAGMKWISSFPGNIEHNMERASAAIFLNEMTTGRVQAVLEGSIISAKRTAASAALAAKYLHKNKEESSIGLIGCGRINKEILQFVKNEFPSIHKVYLYDLSMDRMEQFMSWHNESSYEFILCKDIEELFQYTKLVSFATTAGIPYLDHIDTLTSDHTILGISLRDLGVPIIEQAYNIVDDFDHVCRERTSIHLSYQALKSSDFVAGSIAEVVNGTIPARDEKKASIYSPFGLGVLDLALSNYVFQQAKQKNTGTIVNQFLPQ